MWKTLFRIVLSTRRLLSTSRVLPEELIQVPPKNIRNFSIVAHIDHGKTTLSDRLLENGLLTVKEDRYLDGLEVEKERGITVKARTAAIPFVYEEETFLLNLVDTPGHVDFAQEVGRSLAAVEGAILLIDATQGIEAQTMAVHQMCIENDVDIIPVINKIDVADPTMIDALYKDIETTFGFPPSFVSKVSAKTGEGCEKVFPFLIENILPPESKRDAPLQALVVDSWFDIYRGVVCLVRVFGGKICTNDTLMVGSKPCKAIEVGLLQPLASPTSALYGGQVGYVVTGLRQTFVVGDTMCNQQQPCSPLPRFAAEKSMVYAGVYPAESGDFEGLEASVEKLALNDPSLSITRQSSDVLGLGLRIGFLGTLHMSVFQQRLEEEHDAHCILTPPTVPYLVTVENGEERVVDQPSLHPAPGTKFSCKEPIVSATIVCPTESVGSVIKLCQARRSSSINMQPLARRTAIHTILPLEEVVVGFSDAVQSVTHGLGSFDYQDAGHAVVDLCKVDVLLNKERLDALSMLVPRSKARPVALKMVEQVRQHVPRQQFAVPVQGVIGNKVIVRATIPAMRKDVTGALYGGDVTRKKKLLEKQKKGKKRLAAQGKIRLPSKMFSAIVEGLHR